MDRFAPQVGAMAYRRDVNKGMIEGMVPSDHKHALPRFGSLATSLAFLAITAGAFWLQGHLNALRGG